MTRILVIAAVLGALAWYATLMFIYPTTNNDVFPPSCTSMLGFSASCDAARTTWIAVVVGTIIGAVVVVVGRLMRQQPRGRAA